MSGSHSELLMFTDLVALRFCGSPHQGDVAGGRGVWCQEPPLSPKACSQPERCPLWVITRKWVARLRRSEEAVHTALHVQGGAVRL